MSALANVIDGLGALACGVEPVVLTADQLAVGAHAPIFGVKCRMAHFLPLVSGVESGIVGDNGLHSRQCTQRAHDCVSVWLGRCYGDCIANRERLVPSDDPSCRELFDRLDEPSSAACCR